MTMIKLICSQCLGTGTALDCFCNCWFVAAAKQLPQKREVKANTQCVAAVHATVDCNCYLLPQLKTHYDEELTCIRGSLFFIPHYVVFTHASVSKSPAEHWQRTAPGSSLEGNIHRRRNLPGSSPSVAGVCKLSLRSQVW